VATIDFGSLFTGIGGLDLGLERAGLTCKWQVEIDEYCNQVLEKHWPGVPRFGDVRECGAHDLQPVDLICGGFPCQPVSEAGSRNGVQDERWLWPEFFRIVREIKPKWVLVENVPGLLSIDSGKVFGGILQDLATCGYNAQWDCIPAAAFGAPHLRYRVFLIAYPGGIGLEGWRLSWRHEAAFTETEHLCIDADPNFLGCDWENLPNRQERESKLKPPGICETIPNTNNTKTARQRKDRRQIYQKPEPEGSGVGPCEKWWAVEPSVCRVADGVPNRIHRLRALGNAVVPQVAEWIGGRIMEADQ